LSYVVCFHSPGGAHVKPDRTSDKDLVSEPTNEVEERLQDRPPRQSSAPARPHADRGGGHDAPSRPRASLSLE